MAAGAGSRFGRAKQFEPVGPAGETLLEYAAFDARRSGFGRMLCVIRRALEEDFDRIARAMPADFPAASVVQDPDALPAGLARPSGRTRPWGTVHAVLAARAAVRGPFAVINADDFYGRRAYRLAIDACGAAARGEAAILCLPLEETLSPHGAVARAICVADGEGRVRHVEEVLQVERGTDGLSGRTTDGKARRLTGRELASMNFWVFPDTIFAGLEEQFAGFLRAHDRDLAAELTLPDAVGALVVSGALTVRAHQVPGPWFGLTHERDRDGVVQALRRIVEAGEYPSPLWSRTTGTV